MKIFLWVVWVALMVISLTATTVFVQGIRRDLRVGDPEITLDLSRASEWVRRPFRVSRDANYTLFLNSVNHTPPFGVPFAGTLAVRILAPGRNAVFDRRYQAGATDHVRPDNMHWTTLTELSLPGTRWQRWLLEARVVQPDPAFAGVVSHVALRRQRHDPGMGGLVNYVMPLPAIGSALIALLVAGAIAKKAGTRIPFLLTLVVLAGWIVAILGRGLLG